MKKDPTPGDLVFLKGTRNALVVISVAPDGIVACSAMFGLQLMNYLFHRDSLAEKDIDQGTAFEPAIGDLIRMRGQKQLLTVIDVTETHVCGAVIDDTGDLKQFALPKFAIVLMKASKEAELS